MPNDVDVLDEIAGDVDDAPVLQSGTAFVCDFVGENGVCGETFANARNLGAHRYAKHGIPGTTKSAQQRRNAADKKPGRTTKKPPAEKTASRAAGPPTDRAAIYTSSLSMAALAAYFGIPPFNQADLDICNAGVPNIGRALANLADHNASVARACDLILGGGGGGDYIALLMAVVPVVGAIAANHGLIPATSGARLGESLGYVPGGGAASVPTGPAPSPEPDREPSVNGQRTVDDVIAYLEGTPPTVLADIAGRMMSMGGPIAVEVPFPMTAPTENPDGHRGSEQLRPIDPNVETAEQEPGASVPT